MKNEMDHTSYKLFLTFIKNTENMVRSLFTSGGFTGNLSAQIGVIDDIIDALNALKGDLEDSLNEFKENQDMN